MAYVDDGLGAGFKIKGKRTRRFLQVAAPAALAVGVMYSIPKLKSFFEGEGISPEEAKIMAEEVISGERVAPEEVPPEIVKAGMPPWVIPMAIISLAAGFFLSQTRRR